MRARPITLTEQERQGLETLVRRHNTPQQIATRARIVLAAAGHPLVRIAQQVGLSRESVRFWRDRWVALQDIPLEEVSVEQRLADAPCSPSSPITTAPWPSLSSGPIRARPWLPRCKVI
jgi:putative transposase